jgi:hypothetical protein
MKLNEGAFFAIVVVALLILALGSISLDYWNTNQVRVTYQQAYNKNIECRIAFKEQSPSQVNEYCGKIPVFEDYQK